MKVLTLSVGLAALSLGAMCQAGAGGQGESGVLLADTIEVKWRTTNYTKQGPELSVLATNLGDSFARIEFLWVPRLCDGIVYKPNLDEIRAVVDALGGRPLMRELAPMDWVAMSFPLALTFREVPADAMNARCETHLELHIFRKGRERRVAHIAAPAPLPRERP